MRVPPCRCRARAYGAAARAHVKSDMEGRRAGGGVRRVVTGLITRVLSMVVNMGAPKNLNRRALRAYVCSVRGRVPPLGSGTRSSSFGTRPLHLLRVEGRNVRFVRQKVSLDETVRPSDTRGSATVTRRRTETDRTVSTTYRLGLRNTNVTATWYTNCNAQLPP